MKERLGIKIYVQYVEVQFNNNCLYGRIGDLYMQTTVPYQKWLNMRSINFIL